MTTLPGLLPGVTAAAREAGALLLAEFHRPGGPRGGGDKAPVDTEMDGLLRDRLLALHPCCYVGEEIGRTGTPGHDDCWLVDPHDGTSAFMQGHRGTSVSIALLRRGEPVLGVVFAPDPVQRGPDLLEWAEGLDAVRRNGVALPKLSADSALDGADVLVSLTWASRMDAAARGVAPARPVPMASIAYRLACVAAGDAVATVSVNAVNGYDYAAGHALLRGAGGVMVDWDGLPMRYSREGDSDARMCLGGTAAAVAALQGRDWSALRRRA